MHHAQEKMQEVLHTLIAEGKEQGLQLAVYHHGKLVVDAWAGLADPATSRPVDGDTLFPFFSVGKGVAATLIHLLAQRGKLSYDLPIAHYWPEFAAHGKASITLRHVLSHTAGLPYMPLGINQQQLIDWDIMCPLIADLTPSSEPGAEMLYHGITYSWLLGEVARRVDGRPFGRLFDEETCRPLGIDRLFFGLPAKLEPQVAILESLPDPATPPTPAPVDDTKPQIVPGWMSRLDVWMNRSDSRRACIPASNGIANARSLARHYAALVPGGVDGVELLSPQRVREATEVQHATRKPETEGVPSVRALGYHVGAPSSEFGTRPTAFGHGGAGGNAGFADPEYHLAVGFVKNRMTTMDNTKLVFKELRTALGIPQ